MKRRDRSDPGIPHSDVVLQGVLVITDDIQGRDHFKAILILQTEIDIFLEVDLRTDPERGESPTVQEDRDLIVPCPLKGFTSGLLPLDVVITQEKTKTLDPE